MIKLNPILIEYVKLPILFSQMVVYLIYNGLKRN